ncbi:MAG TPA: hypothetical protein VHT26_07790 [Trebonia sp.]|nr:hypothetical protein [Trebonia sp.]
MSLGSESSLGDQPSPSVRPARRRWLTAAAWLGGSLALTALFVQISLTARAMSDGGNNALQAWDMLHGHLLLHGWQIGDANYYFLELPLMALAEALFGLGDFAEHVSSGLTYMLVTVAAIAVAVAGSRGSARAARTAVVLAVMAAPLFAGTVFLVLEEPDHFGTSLFILGSFLLVDRLPGRWFTAPLLLVILCAGQFEDLTVRYVAVPAIVAVCAYRALAARSFRSPDALLACTALVSVPLSTEFIRLWVRLGGFTTAATRGGLAPAHEWPHHVLVTLADIRVLFGGAPVAGIVPGWKGYFGVACALAGAAGFAWVAWRWRRASRAEQLIAAGLVFNCAIFAASTFATPGEPHEIAAVLPCGAALAARLVPGLIKGTRAAVAAVTATALVAAVPLAYAATRPTFHSPKAPLAAWLEAHGLTYGVGTYDDAAILTVLTGNKVQLRPLHVGYRLGRSHYEVKQDWYFPAQYDATFAVANPHYSLPASLIRHDFGPPAATYKVDSWTVMVYKKNLLRQLRP